MLMLLGTMLLQLVVRIQIPILQTPGVKALLQLAMVLMLERALWLWVLVLELMVRMVLQQVPAQVLDTRLLPWVLALMLMEIMVLLWVPVQALENRLSFLDRALMAGNRIPSCLV